MKYLKFIIVWLQRFFVYGSTFDLYFCDKIMYLVTDCQDYIIEKSTYKLPRH